MPKCNRAKDKVYAVVFYDRITSVESLYPLFAHEFQHALDICGCGKGCDVTGHIPGDERSLKDQCYALACLEIRACYVQKKLEYPDASPDELRELVRKCAKASYESSQYCQKYKYYLDSMMRDCYPKHGTNVLPPLPNYPFN